MKINRVWHLDLTQLRILWLTFTVAAILDGFSRKLLTLHVYDRTPRARQMTMLVRQAVKEYGSPRFIITDHGSQFRRRFRAAIKRWGITPVRGRVRAPFLNGKVERVFRTFRYWWSMILTGLTQRSIQRRLDDYRYWYNAHRTHSAFGGLTPDEAWRGVALSEPMRFCAADTVKPWIDVRRLKCRGDPRLPVIQITVCKAA